MKKTALITGATSGIGKATAIKLAQNKIDIIITGRRKILLNELGGKDGIMEEWNRGVRGSNS